MGDGLASSRWGDEKAALVDFSSLVEDEEQSGGRLQIGGC